MKHPEGIAIAQATALNIMFGKLSRLALANIQTPNFDSLMRLALRAQSQSGRTLETLATLMNPAIFAQQVNVANQQIVANAPIPSALPATYPILSSPAPCPLPCAPAQTDAHSIANHGNPSPSVPAPAAASRVIPDPALSI
jgi:hypothetical protein